MNNILILRTLTSPYGDVTKGSVLSQSELDENFIFLKGNVIYTAVTDNNNITLKKYNGEDITFAGGGSTFTGGTVSGTTYFNNGVSANTISATTLTLNGVEITGVTNGTPFYLFNSPSIDAGSDKISTIQRNGSVFIGDYVASSATGVFTYIDKYFISIANDGFTSVGLNSYTNNNGLVPAMRMYRTRGTQISPSNLLNNDKVGELAFITDAFGLSGSTNGTLGSLEVYANQNHSGGTTLATAMGSRMDIFLIPNNTINPTKALTIIGSGDTRIFGNLTASTVSATTYYNLPNNGIITGGTYNSSTGITTLTNNTGGTFTISGYFKPSDDIYTTGMTFNVSNYDLTITRNDNTSFTQSLAILASDLTVTGGTYNPNTGVATFTNNTGGTFNISGFLTGQTDTYVTGLTFTNNTLTLKQTNNQADVNVLINNLSGLTINGNLTFTGQSNNPIYSAGTVTSTHIPNWNNSNIQTVILSAATTNISGGTNIANGAVYTMILKQNASGSRTVNWGSEYKWQSGIAPILTSTANAVDILTFISDGTNLYGLIAKDFR